MFPPRARLPKPIADAVGSAPAVPVATGDSRAGVFRFEGGLYLKVLDRNPEDPVGGGLATERDRLRWLSGKLTVPEVRAFAQDEARDYLLITEIPGRSASPDIGRAGLPWLVEALAEGARQLHSIPVEDCPFQEPVPRLIQSARLRTERKLVDEDDFDEERRGRGAHALYDELLGLPVPDEDRVFTHGDLCLPNVIVTDRRVAGFVDLGGAGVSDRWRDLALVTRSIERNLGAGWADAFLEAYGIERNPDRIHFFRLLDELF